jgi:DNA-directed RNA polymerase specialized sigma subunit
LSKKTHQNTDTNQQETSRPSRERIDILRSRAALLSGKDRLLMTMYLENANTFRQMAKLAGVNEATVARRINQVTKRLLDSVYITCLRNHQKLKLTGLETKIARDYFLAGLAQQKIAAKRNCSRYRVRRTLRKIQQLASVYDS